MTIEQYRQLEAKAMEKATAIMVLDLQIQELQLELACERDNRKFYLDKMLEGWNEMDSDTRWALICERRKR